jgi:inner membrane protein
MHAFTHGLLSWIAAESVPSLRRRDRAFVLAAGLVPDLDALSILGGRASYLEWHRIVCHNVLFGGVVLGVTALATRRVAPVLLAAATFHLHLLCDVIGSAGPDGSNWPVPYFVPFDRDPAHYLAWRGQWGLASWQNMAITVWALVVCAILGVWRGRTLVEAFNLRADAAVVGVLRARFSRRKPDEPPRAAPRGPDAPPT